MVQALDLEVALRGNQSDDWFSILLFRLMLKSDRKNYSILKSVYPVHAFMLDYWGDTGNIPDPSSEEFQRWVVEHNDEEIIRLLERHDGQQQSQG